MEQPVFRRLQAGEEIEIHRLAWAIWPTAYGQILSEAQIQYMLGRYYSTEAISSQIKDEKFNFELISLKDQPIGFSAWSRHSEKLYKIEKLYLLPALQGKGFGKDLIFHTAAQIKETGGSAIILNVNRLNPAFHFYLKLGFSVIKEVDIPIGNGFFMNDYIMEIPVPALLAKVDRG